MPKSNPTREQTELQHLARVQALSGEVAAAISAIERNDPRQLQTTVANQERICHELAATKWTPSLMPRRTGGEVPPKIGEQIHEAYVTLAQLNRVYAGVVKRSKRSVDLLSALYGDHGLPHSSKLQTLSCEV